MGVDPRGAQLAAQLLATSVVTRALTGRMLISRVYVRLHAEPVTRIAACATSTAE